MEQQLSLFDLLESEELDFEDPNEIISDVELPHILENLLIETGKHAFGESRGGRRRKPSTSAMEWLMSDDTEAPFSFYQCCINCGLDPDTLRESFAYYKRKFLK